jgi:2-polyprenyl-6-methoxyphenol hydroxylase-like FAD-dependent oxidoreductase/catechol 2,3-dioxygenase-like lactoylglutathione lyase family enzyme
MERDVDVAIVGFGPVGQVLAALLGRAGHRVAAFERHSGIYRLPRAVHLDHEIMRLLQSLGLADALAEELVPVSDYHWFGADGNSLLRLEAATSALSGWESDYMFFQPALEEELAGAAQSEPTVSVHRGWVAEDIADMDGSVELHVRHSAHDRTETVRARWLVGADGANSFVRTARGIGRRDLGFAEKWLVVDAEPKDMSALAHLPPACQWCDPQRPTTHIQSGPRHRRWEFMLLPGESPEDIVDPERVWTLLDPWFTPDDGPLTRSTVYEFRSMLADRMRDGRVIIVGDAAHLTPPFLGQGLCSGLRDAANLAWKLDLVLRGVASAELLDTIDPERMPQNEWVIRVAIELGRVLCELDPQAAARRDAALRAAHEPPPLELAPLEGGMIRRGSEQSPDPLAGKLSVQGLVAADGLRGRFDDVVGRGWALIAAAGDPLEHLDAGQRALLRSLDASVASLRAGAPGGITDVDGRLTRWLNEFGVHAVVVRPDFYVFGSAASPADLPTLVSDLAAQLGFGESTPQSKEHPMSGASRVIHPKFHHLNLKTTRLQEMIDYYSVLIGAEVNHQDDVGAWLTNDDANHRIALLAFPNFTDDPEKETHTGLHHSAFEYGSFEELNASYLRLKEAGIEPSFCLDHGMTLSYYYTDPDGNHIELQIDVFGDWAKSTEWMRTSEEFRSNPIGHFVDPDKIAAEHAAGMAFDEIHASAIRGEFAPEQAPAVASEGS